MRCGQFDIDDTHECPAFFSLEPEPAQPAPDAGRECYCQCQPNFPRMVSASAYDALKAEVELKDALLRAIVAEHDVGRPRREWAELMERAREVLKGES
jgi:F420-dependent methylenetetrahydromethanopterin dehydrogenase